MKIEVLQKSAYGMDRFYPLNETAEFIRWLTKQKSLTENQLKICQENGYKIEIKTKQLQLD